MMHLCIIQCTYWTPLDTLVGVEVQKETCSDRVLSAQWGHQLRLLELELEPDAAENTNVHKAGAREAGDVISEEKTPMETNNNNYCDERYRM